MEQLLQMLSNNEIVAHTHARLPLSDAAEAHRILESGAVIGKIVLVP
jgi:NADPH2:quinone reductase